MQFFNNNKTMLTAMGWLQEHKDNLMTLPFPFHANHPRYNGYVEDQITNLLETGGGLQEMINLQNRLRTEVSTILNSGHPTLNGFYPRR